MNFNGCGKPAEPVAGRAGRHVKILRWTKAAAQGDVQLMNKAKIAYRELQSNPNTPLSQEHANNFNLTR